MHTFSRKEGTIMTFKWNNKLRGCLAKRFDTSFWCLLKFFVMEEKKLMDTRYSLQMKGLLKLK